MKLIPIKLYRGLNYASILKRRDAMTNRILNDGLEQKTRHQAVERAGLDFDGDAQSIGKTESQPEAKAESSSDVPKQLVKRVHELYEQLGRQDVRAVEDWDKAQRKIRKEQPAK